MNINRARCSPPIQEFRRCGLKTVGGGFNRRGGTEDGGRGGVSKRSRRGFGLCTNVSGAPPSTTHNDDGVDDDHGDHHRHHHDNDNDDDYAARRARPLPTSHIPTPSIASG